MSVSLQRKNVFRILNMMGVYRRIERKTDIEVSAWKYTGNLRGTDRGGQYSGF